MSYSGTFKPKNPQKYMGNPTNIIYRSTWEARYMTWLDTTPSVVEWSSEEIIVNYLSPIDGRIHRYFPDFVVKIKNKDGSIQTYMIEIKPDKQTREPEKQKRITKRYVQEVATWGINQSKWKAAKEFCEDRKWKFMVLTEKHLFGKNK